jgi:hypothetical protein
MTTPVLALSPQLVAGRTHHEANRDSDPSDAGDGDTVSLGHGTSERVGLSGRRLSRTSPASGCEDADVRTGRLTCDGGAGLFDVDLLGWRVLPRRTTGVDRFILPSILPPPQEGGCEPR